ncbi:MAG: FAD:protein FMN transferase [Chitinophagaceae bacterium]|nr:FAD:protein FMN transferase [Chitinophagaceae bacterium]
MYKKTSLYRCLPIIAGFLLYNGTINAQPRKFHFSQQKMGSPFNLVLVAEDSVFAERIAGKCFRLVDELNALFSDYDSSSQLTHVNGTAGLNTLVSVSKPLWDIIVRSQIAYRESHGAFDITVGALSRIWREARKQKLFPADSIISRSLRQSGFAKLVLDTAYHALHLPAGMQLDLGGIAKGYAAQAVIDYLRQQGIKSALADAGGDMAMSDPPPGAKGWTIGINVPETTDELLNKRLLLQNMAVATSGDAYQYMEHAGKKYSHIIDPRTGYGITSQRNVTVIAKDGATADWLATACSILPIDQAKALAAHEHAEVLIAEMVNNRIVFHMTERFDSFWKK